jgi:hypothetical protein
MYILCRDAGLLIVGAAARHGCVVLSLDVWQPSKEMLPNCNGNISWKPSPSAACEEADVLGALVWSLQTEVAAIVQAWPAATTLEHGATMTVQVG